MSVNGSDLKNGKTQTCGCGCSISKGARKIKNILDNKQIKYYSEKTEENLQNPKTNIKLRFDFYISNYNNQNFYIEYDGEQHFYYSSGWNTKEKVKYTQFLDSVKNEWCIKNNKKLYRIPYYDIDKIEILEDILQEKYLVKEIDHYNLNKEES